MLPKYNEDFENANLIQFHKPTFYSEVFIWTGLAILIEAILAFVFTYLIDNLLIINLIDTYLQISIFFVVYLTSIVTRYISLGRNTKKYNGGVITWILSIILCSLILAFLSLWYSGVGLLGINGAKIMIFIILCPFVITSLTFFIMSIFENLFKNKLKGIAILIICSIIGIILVCLVNVFLIPIVSKDLIDYSISLYFYDFFVFFFYLIFLVLVIWDVDENELKLEEFEKINVVKVVSLHIWNGFFISLLKYAENSKIGRKKKYENMSKEELIKENKSKDAEIKNLKNKK